MHGWFGTYREFVPGVKPVYGTLTPVLTTNPLKQVVAGWGHLIGEVKKCSTRSLKEPGAEFDQAAGLGACEVANGLLARKAL